MCNVAIIGAGKVGTAIAVLLKDKGFGLVGVAGRNHESVLAVAKRLEVPGTTRPWEITREANIVFITTPDRAISGVCEEIAAAGGFKKKQVVIHMSGALPAEVLVSAKKSGALILSLHPLQSFADVEQAIKNLPGSFFCLEGDQEAMPIAKQIVNAVDGEYFLLDSSLKPLYHMGAVVASNFLVTIMHWAIRTYQQLGITESEAIRALLPLIKGSLNNIEALGPANALTGPIARGDTATVEKHLAVIGEYQPDNRELYKRIAFHTVGIAKEKESISMEAYTQLIELLKGGTENER